MKSPDDLSPEELATLLDSERCLHAELLERVSLLLTAAAMRCGGRLEFSASELRDVTPRMLAIRGTGSLHTVVVECPLSDRLPDQVKHHHPSPSKGLH